MLWSKQELPCCFFLMVASYPWLLDAIAARVVDLALNQSQTLETNT